MVLARRHRHRGRGKLGERFASSAFVDKALFLQAQAVQMMDGRRQEASKIYADLRSRFPDSELAPHALVEMGKIRADSGENEKAIRTISPQAGASSGRSSAVSRGNTRKNARSKTGCP